MPYEANGSWSLCVGDPGYDADALSLITRLEADLHAHMASAKPRRHLHSLSVASTAEQMALAYGVDPLKARVAGILHDWDKVLDAADQIDLARRMHIDLGVDLALVQPLLHGITAARHLPSSYPQLPPDVWQAIERHTLGHASMTPLDMVVFVADGIEPQRRDVPAIHATRALVDAGAPLEEVYWTSFFHGVSYVIDTERYLYPGTLEIYNELVLKRKSNS